MTTQLVTPAGTIDLTDAQAVQPRLLGIITTLSAQLAAAPAAPPADSGAVAELEKLLRIQEDRADRLAQRVDTLTADRAERVAERTNLRARVKDLQKSNGNYRDRVDALKAELERARCGIVPQPAGRGVGVSDLQIASIMLTDLYDRIGAQARRTPSVAAATGLRLAAREVARTRELLAERHQKAVAA